jgi:thiamine biosynthesis lipoprotein
MGEEESIKLANEENLPILLVIKTENGFKEYLSDDFVPYLKKK